MFDILIRLHKRAPLGLLVAIAALTALAMAVVGSAKGLGIVEAAVVAVVCGCITFAVGLPFVLRDRRRTFGVEPRDAAASGQISSPKRRPARFQQRSLDLMLIGTIAALVAYAVILDSLTVGASVVALVGIASYVWYRVRS